MQLLLQSPLLQDLLSLILTMPRHYMNLRGLWWQNMIFDYSSPWPLSSFQSDYRILRYMLYIYNLYSISCLTPVEVLMPNCQRNCKISSFRGMLACFPFELQVPLRDAGLYCKGVTIQSCNAVNTNWATPLGLLKQSLTIDLFFENS